MTVTPETLDAPLCEWCTNNNKATAILIWSNSPRLCNTHANEVLSESTDIFLWPLEGYEPEYTILESGAEPMTGEWTIAQLELAARYGAPYPVCGDLTTLKSRRGTDMFESWTGHDPSGEQY